MLDFIKYKVVVRTILASIWPIILYSIGFGLSKLLQDSVSYFNFWSWITILLISVVYPVSQISLWLFFTPIKILIRRKLKKNRLKKTSTHDFVPFHKKGNYAPVQTEIQHEITKFSFGSVPSDITGTFLRNGPNKRYPSEIDREHWFGGDSMIHAVSIGGGRMHYCNRYTRCTKFVEESKAGR